ncbi:beta-ketoacyl synthase N-terminal-like domain-containing protein [Saccharopolyspora spinosa]|uniref:Malonyl-ACP decarboxylase n=1 Tax=Saccharopolyspora spinosa TaxID=60894 RepID=A0A2N3Y5G1_SACSN|nr:beta-ketoacyl synthase N-terminal-like domain-containing protein [Saccharopolyspora spinosa]PKW18144.1 malonyl-ACP decarboxylase [Saccharopolyspora spinosa]
MKIAITGASVLSGLADGLDEFTTLLSTGRSCTANTMGTFSLREWSQRWLRDDAKTIGALTSSAGRAALPAKTAACVAVAATRMAGWSEAECDEAGLLVAGNNLAMAYQAEAHSHYLHGRFRAGHIVNYLDTDAVGTVSQTLGIRGEGWNVGAASASGAVAVVQAARLIEQGEVKRCLVVAPAVELSPMETASFTVAGAMAGDSTDFCRPFDRERCGFVFGQTAAAVTLERADLTVDRALAHIVGYGQRLDGYRGSEPHADGQVAAMRTALARADVIPAEIDLVSAHATGSKRGDPTEAAALAEVFEESQPVINATKAITGHALSAAGMLSLIAVIQQMRRGFVHGNPLLQNPIGPPLAHVGPDKVDANIRLSLCNSFAFSGINASLLVASGDA